MIKTEIKKQYDDLSKDDVLDKLADKIIENEKLKKEKDQI